MKIIKVKDNATMSRLTASKIMGHIINDKRVNLSLTAGRTPANMFPIMIEELANVADLSNIHYYIFDEVPILNSQNETVGYDSVNAINAMFFKPANVIPRNIHCIHEDNYQEFVKEIEFGGGLDLMVIGLGEDGHFCANMPETTDFTKSIYRVDLENPNDDFPWNQPYQDSLGENHARYMYTLGVPSLMKVKELILIVSGVAKAKALERVINGPIEESCPASILRLHPNFVVIFDEEAGSLL